MNNKINALNKELTLIYLPYKNIEFNNDEFISLTINFEKNENQEINISYFQFSFIDEILDEEISEKQCEYIISNLTDVLDIYIYNDIAQNPPDIDGHDNYHHRRINLKDEIKQVNKINRTFYEFFQDIQRILTIPKDLHFSIELYKTNQGYMIFYYMAYLPFSFIIREYNNTQRVFIKKNNYFNTFDEEIQQFIDSHLNIPLKTITPIVSNI